MATPLASDIRVSAAALGVPVATASPLQQQGHVSHVPLLLSLETTSRWVGCVRMAKIKLELRDPN